MAGNVENVEAHVFFIEREDMQTIAGQFIEGAVGPGEAGFRNDRGFGGEQ